MSSQSVMLVGGPASGKTNYIARLWLAFQSRKGTLRANQLPTNIHYVDDAVRHLMALKFAPRSERNMEDGRRDFVIGVRDADGEGPEKQLTVPDITGELWKRAVNTYELPQDWIDALKASSSAILFVRAHSKFNIQPMDWVTARELLKLHAAGLEEARNNDGYADGDEDDEGSAAPPEPLRDEAALLAPVFEQDGLSAEALPVNAATPAGTAPALPELPAQVGFCELIRYLSLLLGDCPSGSKPRVAVVVTAWDMLDHEAKSAGPMEYLKKQFPLLAGRIRAPGRLEIETFGLSIVGGDLRGDQEFRASLKGRDLSEVGYTALMRDGAMVEDPDVTLPIAWALRG